MQAAEEGAFIEFCGSTLVPANAQERMDRFADAIRKVGPEFVILSTDLGQAGSQLPPDGLAAFILALKARGFTDQEVDRMAKENPARLLGLAPLPKS
jgi:microsomal dipeptidase-like Zn-dependent dipeptidase